ncbi:hypothetical protein D3C78_1186910 [compost metagenome]
MNANIISIPLDLGYQIQVGYVKQNDVFLPEEMEVFIYFLLESLEKSNEIDEFFSRWI